MGCSLPRQLLLRSQVGFVFEGVVFLVFPYFLEKTESQSLRVEHRESMPESAALPAQSPAFEAGNSPGLAHSNTLMPIGPPATRSVRLGKGRRHSRRPVGGAPRIKPPRPAHGQLGPPAAVAPPSRRHAA